MAGFDPQDKASWYFGPMTREETNKIFEKITEDGVFLVRESKSMKDDYVLSVKESPKISQYIINKMTHDNGYVFKIGDMTFPDIPALLTHYQTHYLDKAPLKYPAPREKVQAKYDFAGQDDDDLPFKKGEILEVITKDEERWWTARNKNGQIGQIPVIYVKECENDNNNINAESRTYHTPTKDFADLPVKRRPNIPQDEPQVEMPQVNINLPAKAEVIRNRIPNVFDEKQLKLNEGEIVTVLQMNPNGKWLGRVGDREGFFPYTHVRFIE